MQIQSSNLSSDEISKMVEDAKKYEEEDKKRKEHIELRNECESLIYQTKKMLKDLDENEQVTLDADLKKQAEAKIENLEKAIESDDDEKMKSAKEELMNVLHKLSEKLYQGAGPNVQTPPGGPTDFTGAPTAGPGSASTSSTSPSSEGEVIDAEWEPSNEDSK